MRNNDPLNILTHRSAARKAPTYAVSLIVLALMLLLSGCGYQIRKAPQVDSVRLGRIINNTTEPKLQDKLYEALSLYLKKNGIRVSKAAKYELKGTIDKIRLRGTAESEGVAVQYDVRVSGNFYLVGPDGKQRKLRSRDSFIVTFPSTGPLEYVSAQKQAAIMIALDNLAREIAASVLR